MKRASLVDSEVGSTGMIAEASGGEGSPRTRPLRRVLVIVLIVVVVTGFFAAAFTFHFFDRGTTNCWARPANVPASSAYFVVVMANEGMNVGFNGSRFHSGAWPIVNVTQGRNVVITSAEFRWVPAHVVT